MKIIYIVLILNIFSLAVNAQPLFNISEFPLRNKDSSPILTSDLLTKLNWNSIKAFCDTAKGHYAHIKKDSLITTYEYEEQVRVASFEITSFEIKSYKGKVIEYKSEISNTQQPSTISYFDKRVFLDYVNDALPNLTESFKLAIEEPKEILEACSTLLGVNAKDEYGWICEYSTVGMAPTKRSAIIELINTGRTDLLRKFINSNNLQTKLYAIDALIYMDSKLIEGPTKTNLLTEDEWQTIYKLRDSEQLVTTCGNKGSYKLYKTKISELLSDKAIADIPKQYAYLKNLGYLK